MDAPPSPAASRAGSPVGDPPATDSGTRERLLEAAVSVFAERGYRDASLREICRRAGANNAAVNYHFRSKRDLYREVLRGAFRTIHRERPLEIASAPPRDAAEARARLAGLVRGLSSALLEPRLAPHELVLIHEMTSPTPGLDDVMQDIVEEYVRPRHRAMAASLAPLLCGASEREIALRALGVVGRILFHRWAAPVSLRLLGAKEFGPALVEEIVDEIVADVARGTGPSEGDRS